MKHNSFKQRVAAAMTAAVVMCLTLAVLSPMHGAQAEVIKPGSAAVAVMYHRFGDSRHPSTNVTVEQLETHIKELTSGKYRVLPLADIVSALRDGRALPDRTVAITIDDAFASVYEVAWPRFRDAGLPFALFVATDAIDRGLDDYMTWDQLRELRDGGVTIGSQTSSHPHMPTLSFDANRKELEKSNDRFKEELGAAPTLFAYPYGEASQAVIDAVKETGFELAFGQHSGVIGPGLDIFYLPRFAMNETYGSLERLRLAANALPLPVSDQTPRDHIITGKNPPSIGFTAGPGVDRLKRLSCFASHEGRVEIDFIGTSRVEIRPTVAFPKGRTRINCTMPTANGRWRWYGRQFFNK